jgi:hypothetical protein
MRHLYFSLFTVALVCLAGSGSSTSVVRADEPETVESLRKQKLETAQKRFEAVDDAYGDGAVELDAVYAASIGWKNAASAVAKDKKEKLAALEAHRDRMVKIYNEVHDLFKAHAEGGEADKEQSAKFWVLEAKLWVTEATPKESPAKQSPAKE